MISLLGQSQEADIHATMWKVQPYVIIRGSELRTMTPESIEVYSGSEL